MQERFVLNQENWKEETKMEFGKKLRCERSDWAKIHSNSWIHRLLRRYLGKGERDSVGYWQDENRTKKLWITYLITKKFRKIRKA